jgi:RimJ/RimL family protein N-acetyltransferase
MVVAQTSSILDLQFKTKRLVLTPINLDDQIDLAKYFTQEVCEYMDNSPFNNFMETLAFVKYHKAKMEFGYYLTLVARIDGKFVGVVCINKANELVPEFGIWVAKHQQSKGYAKEMIHVAYQWALDQNKYKYILYPSVAENIPSRKLAQYIGGHYLYHNKEMIGSYMRTVIYYHIPTLHDFSRN